MRALAEYVGGLLARVKGAPGASPRGRRADRAARACVGRGLASRWATTRARTGSCRGERADRGRRRRRRRAAPGQSASPSRRWRASASPARRPPPSWSGRNELMNGRRPTCPICSRPMDPEGHVCPRSNGHVTQLGIRASDPTPALDLLTRGEITVKGRMPRSSNATFLVELRLDGADRAGGLQARAAASGRCGTSPPGSTGARSPPIGSPRRSAGASCRRPCRARRARGRRLAPALRRRPTSTSTTSRCSRTSTATTAPAHLRLRPGRQQRRPQERPLPARRGRPDLRASTTA